MVKCPSHPVFDGSSSPRALSLQSDFNKLMSIEDPDKISIMKLNEKFRETFLGSMIVVEEDEPAIVNSSSGKCKFKSILKPSNYLAKDEPVCFTLNDNVDLRINFENVGSEIDEN